MYKGDSGGDTGGVGTGLSGPKRVRLRHHLLVR